MAVKTATTTDIYISLMNKKLREYEDFQEGMEIFGLPEGKTGDALTGYSYRPESISGLVARITAELDAIYYVSHGNHYEITPAEFSEYMKEQNISCPFCKSGHYESIDFYKLPESWDSKAQLLGAKKLAGVFTLDMEEQDPDGGCWVPKTKSFAGSCDVCGNIQLFDSQNVLYSARRPKS